MANNKVAAALSNVLADSYNLMVKTHNKVINYAPPAPDAAKLRRL